MAVFWNLGFQDNRRRVGKKWQRLSAKKGLGTRASIANLP
jgi:hypothetical protein